MQKYLIKKKFCYKQLIFSYNSNSEKSVGFIFSNFIFKLQIGWKQLEEEKKSLKK